MHLYGESDFACSLSCVSFDSVSFDKSNFFEQNLHSLSGLSSRKSSSESEGDEAVTSRSLVFGEVGEAASDTPDVLGSESTKAPIAACVSTVFLREVESLGVALALDELVELAGNMGEEVRRCTQDEVPLKSSSLTGSMRKCDTSATRESVELVSDEVRRRLPRASEGKILEVAPRACL